MFSRVLRRCLHVSIQARAVDKEAIMELRKKTGYTFNNIKKALDSTDNDIKKAEKWLKEEARKQGWAKAAQVHGRATAQGLVAVHVDGEYAAIAEVNCETDFVARNAEFQSFVEQVIKACTKYAKKLPSLQTVITKLTLRAEEMEKLRLKDGKYFNEARALAVGRLGENITLRRVLCVRADNPQVRISGYCHAVGVPPSYEYPNLGKYGALVMFRELDGCRLSEDRLVEIGQHLCQQAIGMSPTSVGLLEDFVKATEAEAKEKDKEKKEREEKQPADEKQESQAAGAIEDEQPVAEEDKTDDRILFQEYVMNPEIKVGTMVAESQIEILDFVRYECGQPLP